MSLCRFIIGLSKSSPFSNRNFCSVASAAVARYPLGRYQRNNPELTKKVKPESISLLTGRPVSLRYRVETMIELTDLTGAIELARIAVLKNHRDQPDTLLICNTVIEAIYHENRVMEAMFHHKNRVIEAMCHENRVIEAMYLEKRVIEAMIYENRFSLFYENRFSLFNYFFNESNIVPNVLSFNLVIKVFCDLGLSVVDDALKLYGYAVQFGADKDTHRLLTQALVNASSIDEALNFMPSIDDEMLYFCVVRRCLDAMDVKDVAEYFYKWRVKCNGLVATIFVDYWFKHGMEEKAMECYNCIHTCKRLHATTGNTLLQILIANGKKAEARSLFYKMWKYTFDSETINIMVNECFKHGEFEIAMRIFNMSRERGNKVQCFSNMVAKLCEHGMVSEAEGLFAEMISNKYLSPDVNTFKSMINGYIRVERVDDAIKTLKNLAILKLRKVSIYQDQL